MLQHTNGLTGFVVFMLLLLFTGCGGDPPAETLVKINGHVTVDGNEESGVTLTIHPVDQAGTIATGIIGEQGQLIVSTFASGDGLRPGKYRVTCQWGEFDPLSRQMQGDRLGGRYADPSQSEIEWTIAPQASQDVGEIRLTTKSK